MSKVWESKALTDRAPIQAFLEQDRTYNAYALGDLEPGMYEQCTWAGAGRAGKLEALILLYRGLNPHPLVLSGQSEGLRTLLGEMPWPRQVYLNCREPHLPALEGVYAWEGQDAMWRMALDPARFCPVTDRLTRLGPADAGALAALYAQGAGNAFSSAQVAQGVFYGLYVDGELVAAAGTHLVSPTYSVAAVGNVFTHPAHRGRGYATRTTAAVVGDLLARGVRDVVLNVRQDNKPAIRIYERLGFDRSCAFLEGPAHQEA